MSQLWREGERRDGESERRRQRGNEGGGSGKNNSVRVTRELFLFLE